MGIAQSRDGVADPGHAAMLRHLSRKATVNIALQQTGEIEAGGAVHGYVEVKIKSPKEVELTNDPRDRYKFSYAELHQRNEVHFSSITVELLGEVNTRVRYGRKGHGEKKQSIAKQSAGEDDGDDSDDDMMDADMAKTDQSMVSGHVVDSTGIAIRTNMPTKNQAHEVAILYRLKRTVARAVSRDSEHLFQEMDSFTSLETHGDEVLEPGMHRFPFAFTVPEDAQSTCTMIRSYNGDNTACSTARIIVHVEVPFGPGDKRPVAVEIPASSPSTSAKGSTKGSTKGSSKKSEKKAAPPAVEVAELAVHSVPLIVRARLPPDPAVQRDASALRDAKHVNHSTDNLTTPIFDKDGLPSGHTLAPIHSSVVKGYGDGAYTPDRSSSAASACLQPFVVDSRRLMSCCCLPCGRYMTLQARSDSFSYCTSDAPRVEWEILSKGSKKVQNVCVELIRKCQWKAGKHQYESELILSQVSRNCPGQGSKVGTSEFGGNSDLCSSVFIPFSDPSSIVCCSSISTSIFSVTYHIRVTARVYPGTGSCCTYNPVVLIPIYLYSRFHSEMGLRGEADEQRLARGLGLDRFPLNSGEAQLVAAATQEYIRMFRMFGGMNYSSHGPDNLVPTLRAPAIYDAKYGL